VLREAGASVVMNQTPGLLNSSLRGDLYITWISEMEAMQGSAGDQGSSYWCMSRCRYTLAQPWAFDSMHSAKEASQELTFRGWIIISHKSIRWSTYVGEHRGR
jgi:hypothetical protein